ncbi:MAG: hypothetical protein H6744_13880 [Deltaproteobacteria bacterium]|nr:hypothetical protein [Deltaproteobacteria bacterium]MCB9787767.1 hypothetical protein [Deltaproteobacteria bacterium]
MAIHEYASGSSVPAPAIPPDLLPRVGPEAPERARLLIAKAMLPMPPDQLGIALGVLARDANAEIAAAATASLSELPADVRRQTVTSTMPGPILDVYAHVFKEDMAILQALLSNNAVLDETVRWMARNLRGSILDAIGSNQVRLVRSPPIIGALIANPASSTPLLARVIETALRNSVDTSRIPGFKPLAEAFFADLAKEQLPPEPDEDDDETADGEEATDEEAAEAADAHGIDDEALEALLRGGEDAERKVKVPLWKLVEDMTLPQKVRLALMGDAAARKILIRDNKKLVAMSVLRSPKITEKEISNFAMDKAVDGEVVRIIARNREWTKNYAIMHSLVYNPKTPPQQTITFIRNLRRRDLAMLARAKEVPSHVTRAAKQLIDKRGD